MNAYFVASIEKKKTNVHSRVRLLFILYVHNIRSYLRVNEAIPFIVNEQENKHLFYG